MKTIPEFPNYSVTRDGRVLSFCKTKPLELKQNPAGGGYLGVSLWREGLQTSGVVHRLVAQAFIPNPEGKRTINHIDGNKFNNSAHNLEWATDSENQRHAYDTLGRAGSMLGSFGKSNSNSIPVIQFGAEGAIITRWDAIADATRGTGINCGSISNACRGKTKTAGGYKWSYE